MKTLKTDLFIGINKPFTVFHASDTHFTFADERDNERKNQLALNRKKSFMENEENAEYIINTVSEKSAPLIHTGDLIDFVSEKNLDKAQEFIKSVDCFFSAGNHEFSLYVGEAKEDAAYRNQSLEKVQKCFSNDIRCSSRIINDVNFIAIDNSYYNVEEYQLEFIKKEEEKGLPIILCVHTPLYCEEFYNFSLEDGGVPVYLMAVPVELMKEYSEHRFLQQKADEITFKAYKHIVESEVIKAVLCGHIHYDFDAYINNKIRQISTGISTLREIYIY